MKLSDVFDIPGISGTSGISSKSGISHARLLFDPSDDIGGLGVHVRERVITDAK